MAQGPYRLGDPYPATWTLTNPGPTRVDPKPAVYQADWGMAMNGFIVGLVLGAAVVLIYLKWFPVHGDPICLL